MQVAALISDLKSLSVCPHQAANDLVSVYKNVESRDQDSSKALSRATSDAKKDEDSDSDLQRAEELVSLHQNVKLKHLETGPDAELVKARQAVSRVLESLNQNR